nr:S1/P1 nuclease [Bacteriovorax sp. HI3]
MFKTLFLCLYTNAAFAWGTIGHQTVGEIAERNLTPNARSAITSILGAERLAIAAVWPDDVRDDPDFEVFKPYHYISIDTTDSYDSLPEHSHDPKDSMTVLTKYPALIKDPKVSRSVKIAALKYLLHVAGDVHQPMHIGKKSDSGANACMVIWDKQPFSLHQIWDGKIIDADIKRLKMENPGIRQYSFIQYADDIIKNNSPKDLSLNFSEWIHEGQLLRDGLYPQGLCLRKPNEVSVINDDYKKQSMSLTEERLLTGGLRLAALLNDLFKDGIDPGTNDHLTKNQIIDQLSLSNY